MCVNKSLKNCVLLTRIMNNDNSRNKKIWVVDHPFTCQLNMDIAKGWEVIKMHIINGSIHC